MITDSAGIDYFLYLVKDVNNLSQCELPTLLSAGIFEIRFSSNVIGKNLTASLKTIVMPRVEYHVKVKLENLNISLKCESKKL